MTAKQTFAPQTAHNLIRPRVNKVWLPGGDGPGLLNVIVDARGVGTRGKQSGLYTPSAVLHAAVDRLGITVHDVDIDRHEIIDYGETIEYRFYELRLPKR